MTKIKDMPAFSMSNLESIYRLCGIEDHSKVARKIEKLVKTFCEEELPPRYDRNLSVDLLPHTVLKNFLKESKSSMKLMKNLFPRLNRSKAFRQSAFPVYVDLVQIINGRDLPGRKYPNGRVFSPIDHKIEEKDIVSTPAEPAIPETSQQSPPTFFTLSFRPKIPVAIGEGQIDDSQNNIRNGFAWEDVVFIINVTDYAKCNCDQIRLPFSQTVNPQKSKPYSEEDFDIDLLKLAILNDPDVGDLDLSNMHFWQENLMQSFRLVQNDMLVLLKAFHRNTILHTPQQCLHLKLQSESSRKRRRVSTPENAEPPRTRGRLLRMRDSVIRGSSYRATYIVSNDEDENGNRDGGDEIVNRTRTSSRIRNKRVRRY